MANFHSLCGVELTLAENGVGECRCVMEEKHLNIHSTAHGGLIFTMLDAAAGMGARSAVPKGKTTMTRTADVHYLRAVRSGEIRARAEIIRLGSHMVLMDAKLYDAENRLCACGEFEMFVIDEK